MRVFVVLAICVLGSSFAFSAQGAGGTTCTDIVSPGDYCTISDDESPLGSGGGPSGGMDDIDRKKWMFFTKLLDWVMLMP